MPDNLTPAFTGLRTLRQPQVLRLAGADAVVFAQAQFANDVAALADGHWQWNAWLNAKGRVLAIFQLLRLDPQQLLLVCHDGDAQAMAEQLRRFVFRRKVSIEHAQALHLAAAFIAPASARGSAIATLEDGSLELDVGSATQPRTLRLGGSNELGHDEAAELAWQQSNLHFGLPHLHPSQREQWTPQQLGLDRLAAYSVKKGCYPGQEIVARTHFLGKAKRAIVLLQLAAAASPGDEVQHDGKAIGSVASIAGNLALAVLPLDADVAGLSVAGAAANALPLLEGLARPNPATP